MIVNQEVHSCESETTTWTAEFLVECLSVPWLHATAFTAKFLLCLHIQLSFCSKQETILTVFMSLCEIWTKNAGISSSIPSTLHRTSSLENEWMNEWTMNQCLLMPYQKPAFSRHNESLISYLYFAGCSDTWYISRACMLNKLWRIERVQV